MSENGGIFDFLSAGDLSRLGRVSIGSRFTADGSVAGSHKSQRKGVSVEFADYRQYVAGDDPKHLDWRVFGRNERLYIREYEEETALKVHLLVDASSSMICGEPSQNKYGFAAKLAAALAYIIIHHQDSAGLALFDTKTRSFLPPKNSLDHLRIICNTLKNTHPAEKTDLASCLHSLAEQTRRRGLVIIFSDLFDDVDKVRAALAHFRRRRHDVIVYHILDRTEVDFPFRDSAIFKDPETGEQLTATPKEIRTTYLAAFEEYLTKCRQICSSLGIDYQVALSDHNPVDFLIRHLRQRALAGR
ncbi:MAG: DUF58 domain-containing protein [Victivallales bacterium]|nr:DUF58 domain-containing protein [Victivallales bacterium]